MDLTMSAARTEFEQIAFSAVKDLLNKTGEAPEPLLLLLLACWEAGWAGASNLHTAAASSAPAFRGHRPSCD